MPNPIGRIIIGKRASIEMRRKQPNIRIRSPNFNHVRLMVNDETKELYTNTAQNSKSGNQVCDFIKTSSNTNNKLVDRIQTY